MNFKKESVKEDVIVEETPKDKLKIKDIEVFDDVYVHINGKLYDAWVTLKNANDIFLCYTKEHEPHEISFNIRGLYDHSTIVDDKRLLILNKEDI